MSSISKISNSYLRTGLLAASLLTPLISNFIAPPAIVYAQEKTAQREQESQKSPLIHRLIFGVGKTSLDDERYAVVRFAARGIDYSVHDRANAEITSGFMPYDELIPTRNYLEGKNDRNHNGKILGEFFGKIGPTHDDYMRDILRELLSRRNELPKAAIAQIEQGQLKYLELKNTTKYGNAKDAEPVINFLPSNNSQKPENPTNLEGKLGQFIINSSQGKIYSRVDGDQISYVLRNDKGEILRKGDMDRNNPRDSLELKIAVESINVLDKGKLKEEGEKQRYETVRNERVKSTRKWLLNISPNISNLENRLNWDVIAEGLVPVFYRDNSLIGVQFRGEYARIEAGDSFAESAIGIVVNTAIDDKSKYQIGVFYQDRREIGKGAHFGVASGTFAYRTGKLKISVYGGFPVTGRQKIKSELTSAESTASNTTGGNTFTTTTRTDRDLREYLEARKVATFIAGYDLSDNFTPEAGIAWYSGKSGRTTEIGDFRETREGIPSELKAIVGFTYTLEGLSRLFKSKTDLSPQVRFGEGKPEYNIGMVVHLGQSYERRKPENLVNLLEMARIEQIRVIRYTDVKEKKSRSPSLSADCPATGTEGVLYKCTITSNGTDFRVILGPAFLALVKLSEHKAEYSGTPPFDGGAGTYQIKIGGRDPKTGLESIFERTITIANVSQVPVLNSIGNKTVNENSLLEFIISCSNCNLTSASNLPSGATYTASTKTFSWKPSFTQSGTYTPTFSAINSDGTVSETITITVNDVNRAPTVTIDSPAGNLTIDAGDFVNFQSTANDPDGDTLTFTWNITTIGGTCPVISNVEDPGITTFNNAATCDISVTVNDGKGGTATSTTRRITVGSGGG